MKKIIILLLFALGLSLFVGCQDGSEPESEPTAVPEPTPTEDLTAQINAETFAAAARLGRGVNLGNALEGPNEGAWGLFLREAYFEDIAEAGFDTVRLPVRFSTYADLEPPYTIDDVILERVDWAIEQAFSNGLNIIVDVHHYEAMMQTPEEQTNRLAGIWKQIAERYQDYPDTLYFEILNEPNNKLDAAAWNAAFPPALAAIRETNPERYVIIGPEMWNNIGRLDTLELPEDDRHIIATFHYYLPHEFTHQGASWSEGAGEAGQVEWGSDADVQALVDGFDAAYEWSQREERPLFIGEFGTFHKAPEDSRQRWTSTVRAEAEKRGFSWSYWDFGTDFAVYNLPRQEWREPLFSALIPPEE